MRIAYVGHNLIKTIAYGGVGKKIRAQMQFWEKMGHTACWFLTSSVPVDLPGTVGYTFDERNTFPVWRTVSREIDRAARLNEMITAIRAYQPDIIFLRFGIYTYPLHKLFDIAPVVMELNTLDTAEFRERGLFRTLLNYAGRGYLFRKSAGIVSVSEEIAKHPSNARFKKPVLVVPNGIDLSIYNQIQAPKNVTPRLAFIGTPGNPWSGEDKLIWLGKRFPDLQIDLIGCTADDFPGYDIPGNISFHGFLSANDYNEVLDKADVGVGTMALHRKKMEEASPLKVREYLAMGIPVLIGYQDTSLKDVRLDCVMEIPNNESNVIDFAEQIRDFAYSMQGKRIKRSTIESLIDYQQMEETRLRFFDQIIAT